MIVPIHNENNIMVFVFRSPTSASEASASRLRLPRMAVDASPRFGGALSERPSSNPARWLFCGRCRSPRCTTSVLGPAEKDLRADATSGTSDCAAAVTTDWYRADSGYRCFGTDGIVHGGWPCGAAAGPRLAVCRFPIRECHSGFFAVMRLDLDQQGARSCSPFLTTYLLLTNNLLH